MRSSTPSLHCISHSFVFLGVFLTELPSLQNMDTTSSYNKPNNYHPQCMPCVKNTLCRQMKRDIKGGMVTTPTSLQDFPKDLMLLIAEYAQQIASLCKSCKRMWILHHGLRIMNTDAWNRVTKDVKRMINVHHLMAHFNDNSFPSLIAAKEYIDNLSPGFFVGLSDLMLWSDISGPYASAAIHAINTTLRSSSRTLHTLQLSCYMPSLCASVMAKNLLNCKSLTTLALSLRIAKNEDGLVSFMDDNTSSLLFKDVFCKGMHMLNLLHLDLSSGSITDSGACALANELCNAQTLTHMHLDLGYNHIGAFGVASLFRLMGQYKKLQSFYLNVYANEKWGTQKNEFAKPFDIQELATTLCSIPLDFQDIGLVDHSVIDLVNTLVNKWNPQVLQLSNNSALLSLNLLYNYNIDVAGVCALQVLINHFAVDVHTTISCDAFDSPHLYSDATRSFVGNTMQFKPHCCGL